MTEPSSITQTHQKNDNPLRNNGSLPVSALIEYGAQAMAVHGALIAKDLTKQIQEGYSKFNVAKHY
jgi:predicted hotdog family 3-hydroxylacyl-ACP dehydratase